MKNARKNKGSSTLGLILKIFLSLIALAYFVLLIAGKWIFAEDSFFYVGINIFSDQENASVWLRSLAYIIFFLTYLLAQMDNTFVLRQDSLPNSL